MVPVFWSLVGVHILKESLPLHERRFIVRFRSRLLSGATREDADEGNCGATRGCGEGSTCRPFHLVMCALKCPAYSRRAVRLSRFRITLCSPPIFPSPSEREGQRPSGSRESEDSFCSRICKATSNSRLCVLHTVGVQLRRSQGWAASAPTSSQWQPSSSFTHPFS